MVEKRRSTRRWVHVAAEIVAMQDFAKVGGHIIDLSAEGMRFELHERVLPGESLMVTFDLPGVGQVDAEAVIAYVNHDHATNLRTVGATVTYPDDSIRDAVVARLGKLPPKLPTKKWKFENVLHELIEST